jgi:hypothetical protein
MKKAILILLALMISGCETMNDHPTMMRGFIQSGNCGEAEAYAYRNFKEEYLDWMLGNVAIQCRRDRQRAIQYYRAGARANDKFSHLSVRSLIELGEKPPEPTTKYIAAPIQRQQPQQIIIQQQPMNNPNACIQDGGGIYCPNHPNTKRR